MSEISFKELPLYSYDYDADYPSGRQSIQGRYRGC